MFRDLSHVILPLDNLDCGNYRHSIKGEFSENVMHLWKQNGANLKVFPYLDDIQKDSELPLHDHVRELLICERNVEVFIFTLSHVSVSKQIAFDDIFNVSIQVISL